MTGDEIDYEKEGEQRVSPCELPGPQQGVCYKHDRVQIICKQGFLDEIIRLERRVKQLEDRYEDNRNR